MVDHGYYWAHRMVHEWNAGWTGHITHHNSEEYNLTTALRQGVFQPFFTWLFYMPLAFFFPVPLYVSHSHINLLYQFWIHTQYIRKCPAWFEAVFNTPSHHRVHHGRNPQYIDKNYGGTLIIFDRLYGTFEPEVEEVVYGVTSQQQTWNPFWANTWHFWESVEAASYVPNLFQRLIVPFAYGPGFNYYVLHGEEVRAAKPPPKLTRQTQQRYDAKPPTFGLQLYGFIQFLEVTLLVVVILLGKPTSADVVFGLYSAFAVATYFNCGAWAFGNELARSLLTFLLIAGRLQILPFPSLFVTDQLPLPEAWIAFQALSLVYLLANTTRLLRRPTTKRE